MQISLTTTGRTTGRPHRVSLYAWPDGERLVVVGSYAGRDRDPDWVANLRTHPEVVVGRGNTEARYTAEEVEGPARGPLWEMVAGEFPMYATYQEKTERLIPLFSLDPAD